MTISQLKGGPELLAFLETLPEKLERNILRGALRAGAKVVADEAKVRTNNHLVRESIGVSSGKGDGFVYAKVRTKGKGDFIAVWEEYGTVAHFITVNDDARPVANTRRGPRKWSIRTINRRVRDDPLKIGDRFVGQSVSHPGAAPHPFLRPALDAKGDAAVAAMAGYITTRLTKEGLNAPPIGLVEDEE